MASSSPADKSANDAELLPSGPALSSVDSNTPAL